MKAHFKDLKYSTCSLNYILNTQLINQLKSWSTLVSSVTKESRFPILAASSLAFLKHFSQGQIANMMPKWSLFASVGHGLCCRKSEKLTVKVKSHCTLG